MHNQILWARSVLKSEGYIIEGDHQMVRCRPWSQVICFETSEGRIYLKSMAEPFANEPQLLTFLLENGLSQIPKVIALNKEQSCFLMEDAGRPMRQENFDINLSYKVLEIYADIQIACISHVDSLINLGVNDWRLGNLPNLYRVFIENRELLKVDGLTFSEIGQLDDLSAKFQSLCEQLFAFGISETLEHCDFHENNILICDDQVTISDFGDSCISHPFFSLASFLNTAERNHGLQSSQQALLRDYYLQKWLGYGNDHALREAFNIASTLKHFVFALSFSRIKACPGVEKFSKYNGWISDSLRLLVNDILRL